MFSKFIGSTQNLQKTNLTDLDIFRNVPYCKKTHEYNTNFHEIIKNLYLGSCICPRGILQIKNNQYNDYQKYSDFGGVALWEYGIISNQKKWIESMNNILNPK